MGLDEAKAGNDCWLSLQTLLNPQNKEVTEHTSHLPSYKFFPSSDLLKRDTLSMTCCILFFALTESTVFFFLQSIRANQQPCLKRNAQVKTSVFFFQLTLKYYVWTNEGSNIVSFSI